MSAPFEQPSQPASAQPAQPSSIATAVKLMYAGAVVSVVSGLASIFTMDKDEIRRQVQDSDRTLSGSKLDQAVNIGYTMGIIMGVVMILLATALWIVMAIFNGKGMNWARIVSTVLAVLSVLMTVFGLTQDSNGLVKGLDLLTPIIGIAVAVLLWLKPSSQYYEACEVARARS